MAVKMLHTCIRVVDLEKSIKFYSEVIGLKLTREIDHLDRGFKIVYLSDEFNHYELELTYNVGVESYEIGNGYSHIAIGVDDLESSHEAHKKMGYEVTDMKGLPGTPPTFYFIEDPDGYKVEVIRNK